MHSTLATAQTVERNGEEAVAVGDSEEPAEQVGIAPAATDNADTARTLDAVIVTAQRRQQNLLDVPFSLTAITREKLQSTGIKGITDLRYNTPGLITNTGSGYTQTFIRGIGNRIQIGADPSVTSFIDDVPRMYASLVDDLGNVDRIEILKGAQGGLYGRNATAGVINIITRQPDPSAFEGDLRLGYGSKSTANVSGYFNIPLNQNAALDLTVARRVHNDYIDNQALKNPYASYAALSAAEAAGYGDTGQHAYLQANPQVAVQLDSLAKVSDLSNQDESFIEAKLLFIGDGIQVRLAADYTDKDDANGNAWKTLDLPRVYGTYQALMNSGGFGSASLPMNYVYPNGNYAPFQAAAPIESYTKLKDYGFSAKADIEISGFQLTSISAFRWNESDFRSDVTGSAVPSAGFLSGFQRQNFYQELRAVSDGEGPFRWTGGITYYNEEIDNSTATMLLGQTYAATKALTGGNGYSVYFQGEYDATDKVSVIGSGRFVEDTKTAEFPAGSVAIYDPVNQVVVNGRPAPAVSDSDSVSRFLPSLTVSYALDRGGTIYGRWARGMKTGGVNPMVHPAQTLNVLNALGPEEVDTYEVGVRTTMLDRRIQFTSSIFYNDYRNLQVLKSGYAGLAAVYFNAGETRTFGADATLNWRVTDIFSLGLGAAYLDAKYTNFSSPGIPELRVAPFDVSGNRMILSPEFQANISADVNYPVSDGWNFVSSLLYAYNSKYYTDDTNAEITSQPGYSMVNFRVGVEKADGRFGAYLSVRNVFDKDYITWGSLTPSAYVVQEGAPRIIMGHVEYRF
nr:TonB-dependent receptor [Luteimonas sp. BDR2-5]